MNPLPAWRGRHLQNRRMQEKLVAANALDLTGCARTPDGDYVLEGAERSAALDEGRAVDFCDSAIEGWIWSIGQLADGRVLASTTSKFYQAPGVRCLFLR